MGLKKFSALLLLAAFCGCEAEKAAAPQGTVVKKNSKEAMKSGSATPSEPP